MNVSRVASQMYVVTSGLLDKVCGGPHANTPRVASVRLDLVSPGGLFCDLPEVVAFSPGEWLLGLGVE